MAWDALLIRVRNRRDRLETPSPAHDLVIAVIEKCCADLISTELPGEGPRILEIFQAIFSSSLALAVYAEALASETGLLRDRHLANDALSYALTVAGRAVEEGVRIEGMAAGRG